MSFLETFQYQIKAAIVKIAEIQFTNISPIRVSVLYTSLKPHCIRVYEVLVGHLLLLSTE
jgi:hypothetical protein